MFASTALFLLNFNPAMIHYYLPEILKVLILHLDNSHLHLRTPSSSISAESSYGAAPVSAGVTAPTSLDSSSQEELNSVGFPAPSRSDASSTELITTL